MRYGTNKNNFVYVDTAGTLILTGMSSSQNTISTEGLALNYTISI